MNQSNEASLATGIKQAVRALLAEELHTCMPGKIIEYDATTRKATVLPLVKRKYLDGQELALEAIPDVPVMLYGVGTAGLRLPESQFVGQSVALVFTERSMDFWLKASSDEPIEPGNTRKFDLTDAIAILSVNRFTNEDSGGDNVELFFGDAVIRIKEDGNIEMGVDTFKKLINEEFQALFNDHVHNFTAAPSGTFATGKPAQATGTVPTTDFGGVLAGFESRITNSHMTSKTKAE